MAATLRTLTALFVTSAALLSACPDDEVVVDNLFLEVTSDAPSAAKRSRTPSISLVTSTRFNLASRFRSS